MTLQNDYCSTEDLLTRNSLVPPTHQLEIFKNSKLRLYRDQSNQLKLTDLNLNETQKKVYFDKIHMNDGEPPNKGSSRTRI